MKKLNENLYSLSLSLSSLFEIPEISENLKISKSSHTLSCMKKRKKVLIVRLTHTLRRRELRQQHAFISFSTTHTHDGFISFFYVFVIEFSRLYISYRFPTREEEATRTDSRNMEVSTQKKLSKKCVRRDGCYHF